MKCTWSIYIAVENAQTPAHTECERKSRKREKIETNAHQSANGKNLITIRYKKRREKRKCAAKRSRNVVVVLKGREAYHHHRRLGV